MPIGEAKPPAERVFIDGFEKSSVFSAFAKACGNQVIFYFFSLVGGGSVA
jgi:hypothetical protein